MNFVFYYNMYAKNMTVHYSTPRRTVQYDTTKRETKSKTYRKRKNLHNQKLLIIKNWCSAS